MTKKIDRELWGALLTIRVSDRDLILSLSALSAAAAVDAAAATALHVHQKFLLI